MGSQFGRKVELSGKGCGVEVGEARIPLGRIILMGAPTPRDVHLSVVGY
jgi:hypothetical protein